MTAAALHDRTATWLDLVPPSEVAHTVRITAELGRTFACRELGLAEPPIRWFRDQLIRERRCWSSAKREPHITLGMAGREGVYLYAGIADVADAFEVVAHECRHAWQFVAWGVTPGHGTDEHETDARRFGLQLARVRYRGIIDSLRPRGDRPW